MTKANRRKLASPVSMAGLPAAFWVGALELVAHLLGVELSQAWTAILALAISLFLACVCSGFALKPASTAPRGENSPLTRPSCSAAAGTRARGR
jgi:hypothetical protein